MVSIHSRARPPDHHHRPITIRTIRRSSSPPFTTYHLKTSPSHKNSREGFSTMDRSPTLFDSMFGPDLFHSVFDGIRRGRRNRYDVTPLLHEPFGRSSSEIAEPSSNVRVIPIKVEYRPSQEQNKSKIYSDSSVETLSSGIKSSTSKNKENLIWQSNIPACNSKFGNENKSHGLTKDVAPINIDDDDDDEVECIEIKDACCADSSASQRPKLQTERGMPRSQKPITVEHLNSILKTSVVNQNTNANNNSNSGSGSNVPRASTVRSSLLGLDSEFGLEDNDAPRSSAVGSSLLGLDSAEFRLQDGDQSELDFLRPRSSIVSDFVCPIVSRDPSFGSLPGAYAEECDMSVVDGEKDINPTPSYPVYIVLKEKLARDNRQIDYIKGDGNCFFRALSKQLYGSERYHKAVRNLITDIIATNKMKFAQFVDGEDVQKHVEKMSENHSWATTCEIYAAATMLQRDIYMLTPDHLNEKYNWLLFKPLFKIDQKDDVTRHPCYITLCNTNGNHYDRVIPDHGGCNCFLPHPELEGVSCSMDLTQ